MEGMTIKPLITGQPTPPSTLQAREQAAQKPHGKEVYSDNRDSPLAKACAAMEAQFINYLFKEMRATIPESGFIPKSSGEKLYTSMLDTEMAEKLSQGRGMGLASVLYEQLAPSSADSADDGEEK